MIELAKFAYSSLGKALKKPNKNDWGSRKKGVDCTIKIQATTFFQTRTSKDEESEPLCKIINFSLSSKFSFTCKTGKVKPLHKKGKNAEPKIYRPVSILPILSKIIERVVYNQVISYLEKQYTSQSFLKISQYLLENTCVGVSFQ